MNSVTTNPASNDSEGANCMRVEQPEMSEMAHGGIGNLPEKWRVIYELQRDRRSAESNKDVGERSLPQLRTGLVRNLIDAVSNEDQTDLLGERQRLVRKSFVSGLDRYEQGRLGMIDWQLNQVEMARSDEHLDRLRTFSRKLQAISSSLQSALRSQRDR
jgi:hypothetical protein